MSIKVVILLTILVELVWEIYRGDAHDWKSALALLLSFGICTGSGWHLGALGWDPHTWQAAVGSLALALLFRFAFFDRAYAEARYDQPRHLGDNFTDRLQTKFIERHKYNGGTLYLIKDSALLIFLLL